MITEKTPSDWQQLQDWTAQILRECGWKAETEVAVKLVRGSAEIDVLATESVQGREYKALVECKNWRSRVPQAVVHAFRTVMSDVGANIGYIVSSAGFQEGAYEAAANTNVKLLTWTEFQEAFEEQWYMTHFTHAVSDNLDSLCSYLEPIPAMVHWDQYLGSSDIARLKQMYHQHFALGALILCMLPSTVAYRKDARVVLPLGDRAKEYGDLPGSITSQTGYREFLEELIAYSLPILSEFRSYRDLAMKRKKGELPTS